MSIAALLVRQFYRRNRTRVYRRLLGRRDRPWMLPHEEDVVLSVLRTVAPRRCLEWGAGASTLQFPAHLPADASWTSVEHDEAWAQAMQRANRRPNVTVVHVPADHAPWEGDGDGASFAAYLAWPAARGPYDFILVDGRARAAALAACPALLAPGGVVVLHDANRPAYLAAAEGFAHQARFQDHRRWARRPAGGVWIGSLDRPMQAALNLELHRQVWKVYAALDPRSLWRGRA